MTMTLMNPSVIAVLLDAPFATASAMPQSTDLAVAAGTSLTYDLEGTLLVRSADFTAAGVVVGVAWPEGCVDGVAEIVTGAGRTEGNVGDDFAAPAVMLPDAGSWPVTVRATFTTDVYAEGSFAVTLASSDGVTEVSAGAGSWLRVWALG